MGGHTMLRISPWYEALCSWVGGAKDELSYHLYDTFRHLKFSLLGLAWETKSWIKELEGKMSFLSLTHCISGRKKVPFIKLSHWDNFSFRGWVSWHEESATSCIVFTGARHRVAERPPVWLLSSAALDLSKTKHNAEKEAGLAEAITTTTINHSSFWANPFENKKQQQKRASPCKTGSLIVCLAFD